MSRRMTLQEAARLCNVPVRSVVLAGQVHADGIPELIEMVDQGHVDVATAAGIAKLPADLQRAILRTHRPERLKHAVKLHHRQALERDLGARQRELPGGARYGLIYADSPYRFEPRSRITGQDRAADNHYLTMPLDAIRRLPIGDIAARDSVLALWATGPMLPQALDVMAAWGFGYKSQMVWTKDRVGTGYWWRSQHELLLIGTRGRPPAPAPGTQFPSILSAPRRRHSEKPEEAAARLEAYFPSLPRIELFARTARPSWARWGNEALATDDA